MPAPHVSVRGGRASALQLGGKASAVLAAGTDAGGPVDRGPGLAPLAGAFALCAVLLTIARRSRPIAVAGLATTVTLLVLLQACGGSSSSNGGSNGGGGGSIPLVTIAPASLTFSSQGLGSTSPAQNVTLTNGASSAMSIASVATTGDFAETNNCGASLAASGSCAISVTFRPTAAGSRTGTLVVTDSGIGSPHSVALTGTGQAGPTAAGTYSINVTGTSGSLVQAGMVSLTVQ